MVEGVQSCFHGHRVDCVENLLAIAIEQGGMDRLEKEAFLFCYKTVGLRGNGGLRVSMITTDD